MDRGSSSSVVEVLVMLIAICALFGLAVGSFVNVVIYRVPRGESVISPRSACPACGTTLAAKDNIPVLSWLWLRGRCRSCGARISAQYPLVELATAALFVGAAGRFGHSWSLPPYLALFAGLVALAWIDASSLVLPKRIVLPLSGLVGGLFLLAAALTPAWHPLWVGLACGLAWFALMFALHALSPRSMGFGDVRLVAVLGLSLGWLGLRYAVLGFFAANLLGALAGLTLIAAKRITREEPIPYGLFLALGTTLAILAGPVLLRPFEGA
jgi:leader peptidase (prepilin peptidase)/N-methyltransferase